MTDADQVSQALAELQEVVRCRCDEAYRDRGLHDPQCECDSAEAVKIVANRIEALIAERKKDHANINLKADFIDKTLNQLAEAEAKLEELRQALLWCSGSADFNEGGVAREGWLKVCAPLLKGESHD